MKARRTPNENRVNVLIALDRSVVDRLDALIEPMSKKLGVDLDRTKVVRICLERALAQLEEEFSVSSAAE